MSITDKLDEIQARANKARGVLGEYLEGHHPLDVAIDEVLDETAADTVPALVSTIHAALAKCDQLEATARTHEYNRDSDIAVDIAVIAVVREIRKTIDTALKDVA